MNVLKEPQGKHLTGIKKRFIEGEDYFVHKKDESKSLFGIIAPNGLITITESGYLMISKVFDDDISWEI